MEKKFIPALITGLVYGLMGVLTTVLAFQMRTKKTAPETIETKTPETIDYSGIPEQNLDSLRAWATDNGLPFIVSPDVPSQSCWFTMRQFTLANFEDKGPAPRYQLIVDGPPRRKYFSASIRGCFQQYLEDPHVLH